MRKVFAILIFINLILNLKIQSQEINCTNHPDKRDCILECLTGIVLKYAVNDKSHSIYYLKIDIYKPDSIIEICLNRICNKTEFKESNFNGFVQWHNSYILVYKDSISNRFVNDNRISKLNEKVRSFASNKLEDDTEKLPNCKDEEANFCICNYEYDYIREIFIDKCLQK